MGRVVRGVVLFLFGSALGCSAPSRDSAEPLEEIAEVENELINGLIVDPAASGHVKLLMHYCVGDVRVLTRGPCSGTLIRNDTVLTAKHCLEPTQPHGPGTTSGLCGLTVTLGNQELALAPNTLAGAISRHPLVDRDVAVVRLPTGLSMHVDSFTHANGPKQQTGFYRPIMPPRSMTNEQVTCFGYGYGDTAGSIGTLRRAVFSVSGGTGQVRVPVQNNQSMAAGDSGTSCFTPACNDCLGNQAIIGVQSTCGTSLPQLSECDLVGTGSFRDWANGFLLQPQPGEGFSAWTPLGVPTIGTPAVISRNGQVQVFTRRADGMLYTSTYFEGTWTPWVQESVMGSLHLDWGSQVAAISSTPTRTDVFARAPNNSVRRLWIANGFRGTTDLGGVVTAGVAATTWGAGRLDVFARGTDNLLYQRFTTDDGVNWSPWIQLPGRTLTSGPAAVAWAPGRVDVFALGTGGALIHWWHDNGSSFWETIGGTYASAPAVTSWGPQRLDIFLRGTDSSPWHLRFDHSWSTPTQLPAAQLSSSPAPASWGRGRIDLIAPLQGSLWHIWYHSNQPCCSICNGCSSIP